MPTQFFILYINVSFTVKDYSNINLVIFQLERSHSVLKMLQLGAAAAK